MRLRSGLLLKGIVVLACMGAAWCAWGFPLTGAPYTSYAMPGLVAGVIVLWARTVVRACPARPPEEESRIARLIGRWSAAEGIAIGMTAYAMSSDGKGVFIPAAVAVIVGLHFLPLARGMPYRLYHLTGLALLLAGAVAMLAPGMFGLRALGLVCGSVLWSTALARVSAARKMRVGVG